MKRFSTKSMLVLFACWLSLNATAQEKALPIEWSGVVCNEVSTAFDNGEWNNSSLMFLTAKAPLWKGASFTGELGGFYDVRIEQGKSWSVLPDRQYFTNLPIDNLLTLSQFNITQQVLDNLSFKFGVFKAGEYFVTPTNSLFLNTSIVTPPVLGGRWALPHYHMAALGLKGQWEIIPGLTLMSSVFNGVATTKWADVFNFRPSRDGIQDLTEIIYKGQEEGSYIGEYRVGMMYADARYLDVPDGKKHKGTAWFAHIDQPVLQGEYPITLTLGGYASKKLQTSSYNYYNAGAVMRNLLLDNSRLGVNLCRAYYADGVHESDIELTYALPVFKNFEVQPGVHFIRTSGESMTGALLRATFLF